jgi:GAF domain-containing protein
VVDGAVWGQLCSGTTTAEPLRADAEDRMRDFAELVAIAISNAESRDRLRRLAEQQTSLRRVATLVAEGASPAEVFSALAEEVARILDVSLVSVVRYELDRTALVLASVNAPGFPVGSRWPLDGPSLFASVFSTGAPARIDDYSDLPGALAAGARASGVQSGLAVPIVVDGRVWGMIAVGTKQRRQALPGFAGSYTGRIVYSTEPSADVEARLVAFTDLIATAISKAQAHDDLQRLAEEQAALRRVATLVAEAARPDVIFTAVAEEVASILELPRIEVVRYEADGTGTVVGASGDHPFAAGSRWALDGPSIMRTVFQTGRPARIDDYSALPGTIAEAARAAGFRSAVGAPIIVDGRTWGTIIAISTQPDPIPDRSEIRLRQFTELVATAVSNATARAELIASRARLVAAADEERRRFERDSTTERSSGSSRSGSSSSA